MPLYCRALQLLPISNTHLPIAPRSLTALANTIFGGDQDANSVLLYLSVWPTFTKDRSRMCWISSWSWSLTTSRVSRKKLWVNHYVATKQPLPTPEEAFTETTNSDRNLVIAKKSRDWGIVGIHCRAELTYGIHGEFRHLKVRHFTCHQNATRKTEIRVNPDFL